MAGRTESATAAMMAVLMVEVKEMLTAEWMAVCSAVVTVDMLERQMVVWLVALSAELLDNLMAEMKADLKVGGLAYKMAEQMVAH